MRLNALNFAINRMFASSNGSAVPSLISRLFTPGTAGFCGGMSVTEAFDAGLMFQDSTGTTPAALEMPVGLVLGQVGSINASQTTSTKRPTLKDDGSGHLYLLFDGIDDCFVTPSIDMTGTDKVTVFAGVRGLSSSGINILAEFSTDSDSTAGTFELGMPVVGKTLYYQLCASSRMDGAVTSVFTGPASVVTTAQFCTSASTPAAAVAARANGADLSLVYSPPSITSRSSFSDQPLYIGARNQASFYFNGHMYTLPIVVGRAVEPALIAEVEAHINAQMGGIY